MRAAEAAELVPRYVAEAQARITGKTAVAEYEDENGQRFERQPLTELVESVREELLDSINYAVFQLYRLDRMRLAMEEIERRVASGAD